MTRSYIVHMPQAESRHLAGTGDGWPPAPESSLPQRPARGPFGPRHGTLPLPGQVEYLGGGAVRLDETAIRSLAGLTEGEDFRVTWTDTGPVLEVGADRYAACEEPQEPKPPS